jgi:hypothetical protein
VASDEAKLLESSRRGPLLPTGLWGQADVKPFDPYLNRRWLRISLSAVRRRLPDVI